jgi:hypothetical protein
VLAVFVVAMAAPGLFCVVRRIRPSLGARAGGAFDERRETLREARQTLRWNRRRAEARGELPPC